MLRRPRVFRCVLVRGAIATKSRVALLTCAQVNPMRTYLYALFANFAFRLFDF